MMLRISACVIVVLFLLQSFTKCFASQGDRSFIFVKCVEKCLELNCTNSGKELNLTHWIFTDASRENLIDALLLWGCDDECKYDCTWKVVDSFVKHGYGVPQFYGKWPFLRMFGVQEPASVIFSVMNFIAHAIGLKRFRQLVPTSAPLYYMWNIFGVICLNGWFWSTVFHTRDTLLTELLDYLFAYSIVISSFYCMIVRVALLKKDPWMKSVFTLTLFAFFTYHCIVLSWNRSYGYNMKINIATGSSAGVGWLVWSLNQKEKRPYVWKISLFVILSALTLALEVLDFPPIYWIFDAHALWHLSTAPLAFLHYAFIIDDTKALLKESLDEKKKIP